MGRRGGHPGGPYEPGSLTRLYVELSARLHIPFAALAAEDDAVIATYLDLLTVKED